MGRSKHDFAVLDTFAGAVFVCDVFAAEIHTKLCHIL